MVASTSMMMVRAEENAPAGAGSVEDGRFERALHPDRKSARTMPKTPDRCNG
jgi:hypothetical protein